MGLNSLPVAFGPEVAKWITVATIDVTQIAVAAYLAVGRHETTYAAVLTALILPQVRIIHLARKVPSVVLIRQGKQLYCKCNCDCLLAQHLGGFEHSVFHCLHQKYRALAAMCQGGELMQILRVVTLAHVGTLVFVLCHARAQPA